MAGEEPNGDIRISLDMRQANRAILTEKHPMPTLEETFQEVSEAKVFSKFQQLIWQIPRDCPSVYNLLVC